jgi:deoxyribonuclease IV
MRRVGVHSSINGGLQRSLERASTLGCNTVQIFSHNPRVWAVKLISQKDASAFRSLRRDLDIAPVYIHTSYLINMASKDVLLRRKSIDLLTIEMDRADEIGADYVVLHTGSAVGEDESGARKRAIETLSQVSQSGKWKAGLLLENTAGERGDISSRIEDLAEIIGGVKGRLISGICFDTCHAYAAGYNISEGGIQTLSEDIEKHIGFDKIKLIHLNDSKGDIGSGRDRHEHIGLGRIGNEGLGRFINHTPLRNIPLILETPKKEETDDPVNLQKVREMIRTKR